MGKRRRKPLGNTIRLGYRSLSILNTVAVLLTGNLPRILSHIMRKRVVRKAGRLF